MRRQFFEYTGDIPQNVNFAVKIGYAMPLIQSVPGLSKRLPSARDARKGVNMAMELEKGTGIGVGLPVTKSRTAKTRKEFQSHNENSNANLQTTKGVTHATDQLERQSLATMYE